MVGPNSSARKPSACHDIGRHNMTGIVYSRCSKCCRHVRKYWPEDKHMIVLYHVLQGVFLDQKKSANVIWCYYPWFALGVPTTVFLFPICWKPASMATSIPTNWLSASPDALSGMVHEIYRSIEKWPRFQGEMAVGKSSCTKWSILGYRYKKVPSGMPKSTLVCEWTYGS